MASPLDSEAATPLHPLEMVPRRELFPARTSATFLLGVCALFALAIGAPGLVAHALHHRADRLPAVAFDMDAPTLLLVGLALVSAALLIRFVTSMASECELIVDALDARLLVSTRRNGFSLAFDDIRWIFGLQSVVAFQLAHLAQWPLIMSGCSDWRRTVCFEMADGRLAYFTPADLPRFLAAMRDTPPLRRKLRIDDGMQWTMQERAQMQLAHAVP